MIDLICRARTLAVLGAVTNGVEIGRLREQYFERSPKSSGLNDGNGLNGNRLSGGHFHDEAAMSAKSIQKLARSL